MVSDIEKQEIRMLAREGKSVNEIKDKLKEFKIGFIRGLIDTDGYRETKFRRYIYGTVSENLRDNFSQGLDELDIDHTNYFEKAQKDHWKTMYKTRITGFCSTVQ